MLVTVPRVEVKKRYTKKRKYYAKKKGDAAVVGEVEVEVVGDTGLDLEIPDDINDIQSEVNTEAMKTTASQSKIIDFDMSLSTTPSSTDGAPSPCTSTEVSGYRLIDMSILSNVFQILCCPECHGTNCLLLNEVNEKKKGLARYVQLSCSICLYSYSFYTPKQVNPPKQNKGGQKLYDVNVRAIYGCRQVGVGHEHLKKLCCYLNMPEPMSSKNYQNI